MNAMRAGTERNLGHEYVEDIEIDIQRWLVIQ